MTRRRERELHRTMSAVADQERARLIGIDVEQSRPPAGRIPHSHRREHVDLRPRHAHRRSRLA